MATPYPDNMGFPIRRSVSDMLPDQLLVEPACMPGRYGKEIHVGYQEYTCAACGKVFSATKQHRYRQQIQKHGENKKVLFYCCYDCYRPIERAAQEKFKKDTMGFVPECGGQKSPLEHARARVIKCQKKLAEYQAIRNDPQAWEAMPMTKRRSLTKMISRWKQQLDDANRNLKEAEIYEPD